MTAKQEYKRIKQLMKKHKITIYAISKECGRPRGSVTYSLQNEVDRIGTICLLLGTIEKLINSKK